MTGYTDKRLGDLQQKVLRHIFQCTAESENVSHIADSLGLKQPTVHKSVESLIENNYLDFEQKHRRAEKKLIVTPKGAAVALVLTGVEFNELKDYTKRHHFGDRHAIGFLMELLTKLISSTPTQRNKYTFKKAMEYFLKSNYFDGGNFKKLTGDERTNFQRFIVAESLKYSMESKSGESSNTVKEFVDKVGIDKKFLQSYLIHWNVAIEKMVKELETE